ncbi:YdeI/OmpD-associated family protein [Neorhizobium galegae]|uniref:YdeI/OmpD-associated family protein n=1 Tax=Neorhizobium galegae TaxID=399 RepID=UPI001F1D99CC|nr:YdeI/OmpD-associated family protein [Neorhizobium galegae]UIK08683.1 YdeI/OmpD-associated family protein [Neorhizobium galegae]
MDSPTQPLAFTTPAEWASWLSAHHATSSGVWLRIGKKNPKRTLITIDEALDVALCHGWIDSQRKGFDATSYLQRYSPRRARSPWSKLNVDRVAALTQAGRMRPAGLVEVEAAKADGRWAVAYEPQRTAALPDDLVAALRENPAAGAAFEKLDKTGQYAVVLPLLKATTPEVRAARVAKAVVKLAVDE